jgi:octaprenyl-diphosphate synthase
MQSIYNLVADEFEAVNQLILSQLHSGVGLVEDISQYLVANGGKRIRPLVTLLCAGALDDLNNDKHIKLATAIEFLHTATLLHDDVVDMSSLRRGQPTANANWGNASSVLVGDFVYSRAFQLIVSVASLDVMRVLSDTTVKIAEGEVKQLMVVGDTTLDEAGYFEVIGNKTAQLFAGACESAAVVANAHSATRQALREYGMHLGLAFQLVDDYLDYSGDAKTLGKNVGDDLAEGKLTLPVIEALRQSRHTAPQDYQLLLNAIAQKDVGKISDVVNIVQSTGAMAYTLECAQKQIDACTQCLESIPDSTFKSALIELSHFVISRTF